MASPREEITTNTDEINNQDDIVAFLLFKWMRFIKDTSLRPLLCYAFKKN